MKTFTGIRKDGVERGSQLLELAFLLPFLLVLVAGAADFAQAWNARQTLANAARDGARLASTQNRLDLSETAPSTIQRVCQQVADYLIQQNMNPAFMGISGTSSSSVSAGCSSPGLVVSSSGSSIPAAFTYYESGTTYGLKIERDLSVTSSGGACTSATDCVGASRITLTYPYHWAFGFNRVIRLFGVGSGYASTIPIQVYSVMPNMGS